MSYKDYLKERSNYYVLENFQGENLSKYNNPEEYNALLKRIISISNNIQQSLSFLRTYDDDIDQIVEKTIDKLEEKLQSLHRAAVSISKSNSHFPNISDISVVELTAGKYEGLIYSTTQNGLILDTKSKTKTIKII